MRTYRVRGVVVDQAVKGGVPELRVEAWDRERICTELVGHAVTDRQGAFAMTLTEEDIQSLFPGRHPELYFRVLRGLDLLADTELTARWTVLGPMGEVRIEVDLTTPIEQVAELHPFIVRGRVRDSADGLQETYAIAVFDRGVRSEIELGRATATPLGDYAIPYSPDSLPQDKHAADVFLRAYDASDEVVAESPVRCHAPPTTVINLDIGDAAARGVSEQEYVERRLNKAIGTISAGTLTDDEIDQLACSLEMDRPLIAAWCDAVRINTEVGPYEIAPVFYALIRQGLQAKRRALLTTPPRELRRALEAAIESNILGLISPEFLDIVMDFLKSLTVDLAFETPDPGTTANLGDVIGLALSDESDPPGAARTFVERYTDHQGSLKEFWDGLVADSVYSPATVERLRLSLQWGALTRYHAPLMAELEARRAADVAPTLKDLAWYSEEDWLDLLERPTAPIGCPEDVPGDTPEEQRQNYAKILTETMAAAFPTTAIHAGVRGEEPDSDLDKFLSNNLTFEFGNTRVRAFMTDSPDLSGISDAAALEVRLRSMERIFKLAPSYREMSVLLGDGVTSARSIKLMGSAVFSEKYRQFGNARVEAILEGACYLSAATTYLFQKYSAATNELSYHVLPDLKSPYRSSPTSPLAPEVAQWSELFGSLDLCACDRCQSVHGPAAYLVDLLQFLAKQPSNSYGKTAKDILLEVRPDIAHIVLSCDNTNIALPQVDLNIEIMERAIAGDAEPLPTSIASTGTTGELLAMPEVIDPTAREIASTALSAAVFPWSLPLDFAREEARVYLEHLGVRRWQLMEAFQSVEPAPSPSADEIAQEHLGMSDEERRLVLGEDENEPWDRWGLPSANWEQELLRVDVFLAQSDLSYEELLELIDSAFLHGFGSPALTPDPGADGCDLAKIKITGLSSPLATVWSGVHRFLRLRQRLAWSITELDYTTPIGTINAHALRELSELARLRELVKAPVAELFSWWINIDARIRPESNKVSPYARLFLDKAVENPPPAAFVPLPNGGGPLSEHKKPILAALRISEADFQWLTVDDESKRELTLPSPLLNNDFNLGNLSRLYRIASLARAIKIPLRELMIFRAILGNEPLAGLSLPSGKEPGPAEARIFIERLKRLRSAGWSASDLHYVFRHVTQPFAGIAPEDALREERRSELEDGLAKIAAETAHELDPSGAALEALLMELLTVSMASVDDQATPDALRSAVAEIFKLIRGENIVDPGDPEAIPPIPATHLSHEQRRELLLSHLGLFCEGDVEREDLVSRVVGPSSGPPPQIDDEAGRVELTQSTLLIFVQRRDSDALIQQKLSEWLKVDVPTIRLLLAKLEVSSGRVVLHALRLGGESAERDEALILLTKVAMILNRLQLTLDEVEWTLRDDAPLGWLRFDTLPVALHEDAETGADLSLVRAMVQGLERLMDLVALRSRVEGGVVALRDFIPDSGLSPEEQAAQFLGELATRTGWRLGDVLALAPRFSYPDEPRSEAGLKRLASAFDVQRRLGATPVETLIGWTSAAVTLEKAKEIRFVAKAKHSPEDWLTIARPLRDVLREKHRAALVAYLVHSLGGRGPDDLLGKLLVDVEVSSCQLTSRIKHAIGSVQLFVQRSFLDLEPEVQLGAVAAKEWTWLKSFVAWEAARKVFLYPENWIEPELRDNKTPFFRELESELLQNDITDESAENAYKSYLEKLDAVARLDVCGMVRQEEGATKDRDVVDVLHVFGRTEGVPHIYYYRTRVDSSYWTPWVKVDLEIPGDHILPAVFQRRLRLYWPVFEDKADDDQNPPSQETALAPYMRAELQMAATELKGDRWLAPKITAGKPVICKNPTAIIFASGDRSRSALDRETVSLFVDHPINAPLQIGVIGPPHKTGFIIAIELQDQSRKVGAFELADCGRALIKRDADDESFVIDQPSGTSASFMDYVGDKKITKLVLSIPGDHKHTKASILDKVPKAYRVHMPHVQYRASNGKPESLPRETDQLFYKDEQRTYFIHIDAFTEVTLHEASPAPPPGFKDLGIEWEPNNTIIVVHEDTERLYVFDTFYHPYVCRFISELNRSGVDALRRWSTFDPPLQLTSAQVFDAYNPTKHVATDAQHKPLEDVDFSWRGAYSAYNWELFFHIPFMIAVRLSKNRRFAEAQKWFHAIFDPTDGSNEPAPQRYWKVKPFYENKDLASIQEEMLDLGQEASSKDALEMWYLLHPEEKPAGAAIELPDQIAAWRKEPYNPHLLARLRPIAYQKATVMRYIENLLEWGDQSFRRDTIESINEATQLYILARTILGDRPRSTPPRDVPSRTYAELEDKLDEFSNAIEELAPGPGQQGKAQSRANWMISCGSSEPPPMFYALYFCIPQNEKMLGYWDLVDDRLFKIRSCMNIEGVVRELPLFEPPVDPALLVAAAAAGVDIGDVLNDLAGPPPVYRFQVLHAKAIELCSSVANLGAAVLAALEKRDAEEISRLRSRQEVELLTMIREVRSQEIKEAEETLRSLELSQKTVETRRDYYRDIEFMSSTEIQAMVSTLQADVLSAQAQGAQANAAIAFMVPDFVMGVAGFSSPASLFQMGGTMVGHGFEASARSFEHHASKKRTAATMQSTMSSYQRRWDDWKFQERIAEAELKQIEKQIIAAQIRLDIAKKQLENHRRQIDDARQVEEWLKSKYTNQELYIWMVEQTTGIHRESYQLAYDMAKRAEKAWQFERGEPSTTFLKFGYWDSIKKGLLAAEKLQYDLRRMESAYLAENKREHEITKNVSLAEMFPVELLQLQAGESVEIELREEHFDLDYPGHYMRRIKSLSMTIAAVTGPYTGVNCVLTQLSSVIRKSTIPGDEYALDPGGDPRALTNFAPIQSICTSTGLNDAGLFELNFRDERFLPFEGSGVIGRFRIEIPAGQNRFDLKTLTDVVLHIRYTARDGGKLLKDKALEALDDESESREWSARAASRLFSAKRDFPQEWERFLTTLDSAGNQILELPLRESRLPFVFGQDPLTIVEVRLGMGWNDDEQGVAEGVELLNAAPTPVSIVYDVAEVPTLSLPKVPPGYSPSLPGVWRMRLSQEVLGKLPWEEDVISGKKRIQSGALDDVYILVTVDRPTP